MRIILLLLISNPIVTVAMADVVPKPSELTATEIVEKNVVAKGGIDAWRNIKTMVWAGHIETKYAKLSSVPFVLEQMRPYKSRFEVKIPPRVGLRVYDGSHGWKLSPRSDGMLEIQPYTQEELRFAKDMQGIDGSLIDYKAKGNTISLVGIDDVEGHKAYMLKVDSPSGASHHVWIDVKSFLEVKSDRTASNAFGMKGTVYVYYRDFQESQGVKIPRTIETGARDGDISDKMVIEKVFINPPLAEQRFTRRSMPGIDADPSSRNMSRSSRQFTPVSPMMRGSSSIVGRGGGQ